MTVVLDSLTAIQIRDFERLRPCTHALAERLLALIEIRTQYRPDGTSQRRWAPLLLPDQALLPDSADSTDQGVAQAASTGRIPPAPLQSPTVPRGKAEVESTPTTSAMSGPWKPAAELV